MVRVTYTNVVEADAKNRSAFLKGFCQLVHSGLLFLPSKCILYLKKVYDGPGNTHLDLEFVNDWIT